MEMLRDVTSSSKEPLRRYIHYLIALSNSAHPTLESTNFILPDWTHHVEDRKTSFPGLKYNFSVLNRSFSASNYIILLVWSRHFSNLEYGVIFRRIIFKDGTGLLIKM